MKNDSLLQVLNVMKKYSGADELTQAMVQELIEKVIVLRIQSMWRLFGSSRMRLEIL